MKVYYATSTAFKERKDNDFYQKTINYVGFKVGQKNLFVNQYNPLLSEEVDTDKSVKLVKQNEKALRECDVFIADITNAGGGIGFQIAMALIEKKPVLAVRYKGDESKVSHNSITSQIHKNITFQEYDSVENITKIIDQFIEEAKSKIDTKFILIIPSEIDKYLSWAGDFYRMHKAQVVRKAVEATMAKDKDWKAYQKETVN